MPEGAGKYDYLATIVREAADADAVIMAIFDGSLGHGFSVQIVGAKQDMLPYLLRITAKEMLRAADEIDPPK